MAAFPISIKGLLAWAGAGASQLIPGTPLQYLGAFAIGAFVLMIVVTWIVALVGPPVHSARATHIMEIWSKWRPPSDGSA